MKYSTFFGRFKKTITIKVIAIKFIFLLLFQIGLPTATWALTSGPGQQEYASFEPASTSDLVNIYNGSFTYNIPLLSVPGPNGGYPINIAYHSGIGMDQEASWVGLGWTLNIGAINRSLNGIPDDINGMAIQRNQSYKNSITVGMGISASGEYMNSLSFSKYGERFGEPVVSNTTSAGRPTLRSNIQIFYNNFRGLGVGGDYQFLTQFRISNHSYKYLTSSIGISYDSNSGIGISPTVFLPASKNFSHSLNLSINARNGLNGLNYSNSINIKGNKKCYYNETTQDESQLSISNGNQKHESYTTSGSTAISFFSPSVNYPLNYNSQSNTVVYSNKLIGKTYNQITSEIFVENFPPVTYTTITTGGFGYWDISTLPNFYGYYSSENLVDNSATETAFGYMFSGNGDNLTSKTQDYQFNNSHFSKNMPYLPSSRTTYDAFIFSGQGTGGGFRFMKNDHEIYSPSFTKQKDITTYIGAELALPQQDLPPPPQPVINSKTHIGIDLGSGISTTTTGEWDEENLNEHGSLGYFKLHGEKTGHLIDEDNLSMKWGGDKAVRYNTDYNQWSIFPEYTHTDELFYNKNLNSNLTVTDGETLDSEKRRSHVIKNLSVQQAQKYGYTRSGASGYYYLNANNIHVAKNYGYDNNQISEIQINQPNGMVYIYGLPAYNKGQKEVIKATSTIETTNLNTTNVDINTHEGTLTEFSSETILPDYAHSWLLTHIVGPDYVDKDNIPGPSDGDLGYWVKITYKKTSEDFRWRIPFNGANFHKGHPTNNDDNTTSFSTGLKDVFYVYSVETKTHIAIFNILERRDGHDSSSEYAQINDSPGAGKSFKLDNIALYSKNEYYNYDCTTENPNAKPLQKVKFDYDYSLCGNVPNNDGLYEPSNNGNSNLNKGKLTLKKITFYSENSKRGELSPYEFEYSSNNPDYEASNVDRWGNYKNNTSNSSYSYGDFPYTEQPKAFSPNQNGPISGTWCLTKINLPTGGELKIEYEPNEYSYVEAQPCMRMFDIVGIGNSVDLGTNNWGDEKITNDIDNSNNNPWYNLPLDIAQTNLTSAEQTGRNQALNVYANLETENDWKDGYRVFFELEKEISITEINNMGYSTPQEYVLKRILKGLKKMYFKNYTHLKDEYFDFVEGYADIKYPNSPGDEWRYYGLCQNINGVGNYKIGYITISKVPVNKKRPPVVHCNEMTRLAMEFLRTDRPEIAYSTWPQASFSAQTNGLTVIGNFISVAIGGGLINEALGAFLGHNLWTYTKQYGRFIQLNGMSVVRLYDENENKFGGGDRVSKITINDKWKNSINNPEESIYGSEYIYTLDGNKTGKSSGVAYEPSIGGEESSLRQPIEYEESSNFLSSNITTFMQKPLLEKFYPGASVGYSKVYVRSLAKIAAQNDNKTFNQQAAPATLYEFYTPKDFPIIESATDLSDEIPLMNFISIPGIYTTVKTSKIRSQGYSIITNDMAGKLKAIKSFQINDDNSIGKYIGGQELIYNLKSDYSENSVNEISSLVPTLRYNNGQLQIKTGVLGQEVEIFSERQETENKTHNFAVNSNFEIDYPAQFILPFISVSGESVETSFRTVVLHKVIHRSGILKKTIITTDQSSIETENLAFDLETGEPILTKVNNGFNDPVYNVEIPAYWHYKEMGPAYKSADIELRMPIPVNTILNLGSNFEISGTSISSIINKLNIGDEIYVETFTNSIGAQGYITFIDQTSNKIYAILRNGNNDIQNIIQIGPLKEFVVTKSGSKNQQLAKAGSISFKKLDGFSEEISNNFTSIGYGKVLNASAIKYKDEWQGECITCDNLEAGYTGNINPFLNGNKGIWRSYESFVYKTNRSYNNNSREDGIFNDFTPFNWQPNASNPNWISTGEITKYSRYGYELETKDALGIFSAALYGYNNSLVTAICQNSKYHEMYFDGFEDYYQSSPVCLNCTERQINFQSMFMISGIAHSGKNCLKVLENNPVNLINIESKESMDCENYLGYSQIGWIEDVLNVVYKTDPCDCLPKFHFIPGKEYLISYWIKDQNSSIPNPMVYEGGITFTYKLNGSVIGSTTISPDPITNPKNRIIEGWQRVSAKITIPNTANSVDISFINSSVQNGITYYDDLRIHPYKANMKSFVYDPLNYKVLAELDENNYATFYIYDEAGNLIMIKKETEKGIKTITEGRSSTIK